MVAGSAGMDWRQHGVGGMRSRVAASIVAGVGWLVFILLFAAFWASPFTFFQNLVIFFVSIILVLGLLGVMWAMWGMRWAR
ncbi:MAG TPA: hypothetical protein VJ300_08260 [Thermoplasmata archaeon]|nr:hypothetical protein [Thermoplasmata archaeon]